MMSDKEKKSIKKLKKKSIKKILETIIEEEPLKPILTCDGKCDKNVYNNNIEKNNINIKYLIHYKDKDKDNGIN